MYFGSEMLHGGFEEARATPRRWTGLCIECSLHLHGRLAHLQAIVYRRCWSRISMHLSTYCGYLGITALLVCSQLNLTLCARTCTWKNLARPPLASAPRPQVSEALLSIFPDIQQILKALLLHWLLFGNSTDRLSLGLGGLSPSAGKRFGV